MIDAAEWEALKERALDQLIASRGKQDSELQAMRSLTGIEWVDPGERDKVPPTPPRRDLRATVRMLPRHLRRRVDRLERQPDHCGLFELLGHIHDAFFEAELTGDNRLDVYLVHLAECSYSRQVHRFIVALHWWVVGGGVDEVDLFAKLLFSQLVAAIAHQQVHGPPDRLLRQTPLALRPRLAAHAPPDDVGVKNASRLAAA